MNNFKSVISTIRYWLNNNYVSNGLYIIGFILLYIFYINPKVDFETPNTEGIQFENITLNEAFKKAKTENKPIFIDVYATWCGPCKRMKKFTFTDNSLGDYYNNHFINLSIDGETKEGRILQRYFPFSAFPTVFIVSPEGDVLLKEEGFSFAFSLLNKAKKLSNDEL